MANKFTISTVFAAVDKMTAPIKAMTKSVGDLSSKVDQSSKAMKESLEPVGKVLLGMAAAAAAAGVAVFGVAIKASEAADSINDTAMSLGLSTDALQEYRYLANLAGMSTQDMDSALSKLTINLGKGGDTMDATLAQLGLSVEQLKAAGPDQVLELVADGMAGITDATTKAAITTQLFGKSSVRMVNALSGGADAIRGFREEAHDAGYVMGKEAVNAGADMGDSLDRLKMTFEGLTNSLGSRLFPTISKVVKKITDAIKPGGKLSKVMEKLGKVFDVLGGFIAGAIDLFIGIFDILEPFAPVILAIVSAFAAYKAIMTAIQVVTALQTAAQIALNLAMTMNPIGLVIVAISALIGIGIALIANWDAVAKFFVGLWDGLVSGAQWVWQQISTAFQNLWTFISGLLDNPVIATLAALFAPFITIPALIIKNWSSISEFFSTLFDEIGSMITGFLDGPIMSFVDGISQAINGALEFLGLKAKTDQAGAGGYTPAYATGGASMGAPSGIPLSPQTSTITKNNNSTVDFNFNNPPAGSSIKQTGYAPGVSLNMGKVGTR